LELNEYWNNVFTKNFETATARIKSENGLIVN